MFVITMSSTTTQRAYPKVKFLALDKPRELNGRQHGCKTGLWGLKQPTGEPLDKPTIQIPEFCCLTGHLFRMTSVRKPNKITLKWVKELAKLLSLPCIRQLKNGEDIKLILDYNWELLRDAVFKPNKEHIMMVNGWDRLKWNRFITDGYVFINMEYNKFEKKEWRDTYEENNLDFNSYPSLTNFWNHNHNNLEY